MKWEKFTIETTTEAVDIVSNLLYEAGIEGIEIEDKIPLTEEEKRQMFIDFVPEPLEDDGVALIHFYLEEEKGEQEIEEILSNVKEGLLEMISAGSLKITRSRTEDKDWIDNWKEFFKPFYVDENIIIKPTWERLDGTKENDIVIELDPGTAFGTGAHETTKLCILNMKKYMKQGAHVLDLGCGSGILSIAARKLGAKMSVGCDIDPIAVEVSAQNAAVNGLSGEDCGFFFCDVLQGGQEADKEVSTNYLTIPKIKQMKPEGYDLILANILADVIIPLSEIVPAFMKPDAYFISSGIINTKAEEVKAALEENGFSIIETAVMGEWVSYVAILK